MNALKRVVCLLTIASFLTSATAAFADNTFEETFKDAFYGGALGALVGGALLAFTKKPADHLDYMAYGAASGVLVGAAYGITKSARALAELDNGRVRLAMPTIIPDFVESPATKQTFITWRADIFRGTFQ